MINRKINGLAADSDNITLNKLKESESKYRLLAENSMNGIYQVDLLGRIVYANRTFYEMLGYEKDEFLNKHFSSLVCTKELLKATIIVKDIFKGKSIEDHIVLKRKDGTVFPSYFTASTLRRDGKIIGLTGSVKDLSQLQKIEKEMHLLSKINIKVNAGLNTKEILDYAVKQISKIFNFQTCGIYFYENGNNYITLSAISLASGLIRKIEKVYGMTIKNMKIPLHEGSGFKKTLQSKQTLILSSMQTINDFSNNKNIQAFTWLVTKIIGFKFSARIPLIISEKVIGILGVTSNDEFRTESIESLERFASQLALIINKLKKDNDLQNSEKQLKDILDATPAAIIHTRISDNVIVYANNSLSKLLKMPLSEIIGNKSLNFYSDHELKNKILNTLKKKGHIENQELKIERKNGTFSWITASIKSSYIDGKATLFTSFTDITEQKRVEKKLLDNELSLEKQVKERTKELNKALLAEKELNQMKSNFVSMASHEFRTPLTAILSASDILKIYLDRMTKTEIRGKIDKIQKEVKSLVAILEDFLVIGKNQIGKIKFKPEKIDFKFFCNEIINEIKDGIGKDHNINYVFKEPEMVVNLDITLLKHITTNLLSNAIKYSDAGSKIEFHVSQGNGFIVMQFNDEGIGIPDSELKYLFLTFHRASNVGAVSGTGLGMAIVKQSIELHNGQIMVNSTEGVGTEIEVTIPFTQ